MTEPTIDLLPCPFCNKPDTAKVSSSFDIYDDDQGNGECWAVFCDASNPNGRGGCGASGGFKPTQDEAIEAWNKRARLKSLDAQPVPVEPDVEALVETLRGFGRAYPEDIFGPVTQQETKEHGNLITRNSAAMGRHCAQFMVKAADMIDFLQSALKRAQEELASIRDALAGQDYASLPSDFPTVRMAHTIRADHDKFMQQVRDTCKRAEKAEALAEQFRKVIDQAARVMRGEGVNDQGEAWDKCLQILDAAIDSARTE